MRALSVLLVSLLVAGCTGKPGDTGSLSLEDADGDGVTGAQGDCDDGDARVYPGADEVWYDGVDQDCDGNDTDQDGDGFAVGDDCDDTRATVHPAAAEACNGLDDDCDGSVDIGGADGTVVYVDADGDGHGVDDTETTACEVTAGWATQGGDCDDAQPSVYAGAEEVCDDLDNDCDGEVNEGGPGEVPYYRDADADGYGDPDHSVLSCRTPAGYVADATDCDDAISVVHPGAPEYCDETDRDCDGDAFDDPVDGTPYYVDLDGDGYGDPASEFRSCEAVPDGMIPQGGDCDDGALAINPGAPEVCDGVDNDCTGAVDDGIALTNWYADADGDGFGDATAALAACDQPEGYVSDATDCDDADAVRFPGAVELCDLEDDDCDGLVDEDGVDGPTWYADADGDGYGDADVTLAACDAPAGYSADADDCDDADAARHPGAAEADDMADDDCDGWVDEDFVLVGDVIVSEVTRQPRVGYAALQNNAQWFEVHNTSARDIDLSNWYVSRVSTALARDGFYVDPADAVVLGAGEYAVFCKTDDYAAVSTAYSTLVCDYYWGDEAAASTYAGTYHDNTFNLQRDQDSLQIHVGGDATTGTLIDGVSWYYDSTNGYWPRDATRSLNLDPAALDGVTNDDIGSWCSADNSSDHRWYYVSATNAEYGTPGAANHDCP